MELKLYIKQTEAYDVKRGQVYYDVPAGSAYVPQNVINMPGQLPAGSRRWRDYGSYIDITTETSNLYKLKLTWTTERDNSGFVIPGSLQQQKSASGTLTFEGEAYHLLKHWLIDDISAPLNCVDVKIAHVGCGEYLDYTIKSSDLRWCEGSYCTFDVTLKQKDEALNCIKSTMIADNWQGWFQEGDGIKKKHPRFSYCNEIRPNGQLVLQWYLMSNVAFIIGIVMTLIISIMVPMIIVFITIANTINLIIKFINALGGNIRLINTAGLRKTMDDLLSFKQFKDNMANFFIEAAGCGREHPAPLIRDYISNVCAKCGVEVNEKTAPIFFAQQITIETSDRERGTDGIITTENPHYNACYLHAQTKRGIRRMENLRIIGYSEQNTVDFYINDNRPLLTLDMFLDELKPVYNAEWRVKSLLKNGQLIPHLFFQRKDFFKDKPGTHVYDFTNGSADRNKLVDGICYEWNERKTPAYVRGLYETDAADSCGNEAGSQMNGMVSFGNVDANPTFEGEMNKTTQFGATKFRQDGASTDYIMDAFQVCVNGSFMSIFIGTTMLDAVKPALEAYADYALLMRDETCTLPKILIWDGASYQNAKAKRYYKLSESEPGINTRFCESPLGVPVKFTSPFKHYPKTFVRGSALTLPTSPFGIYRASDTLGLIKYDVPAMLVNYPMYFEPGYYDTLWDWFHWIDDPRLRPILNQNWTAKIELCCDDLKDKLKVFGRADEIMLGEKVKLPNKYYGEGTITEIEVSYDPTDDKGKYIQLKGTV